MGRPVREESSFPKYTLEKYNVNVKVIKYVPVLILFAITSLEVFSILTNPAGSPSLLGFLKLAFLIPLPLVLSAFIGFLAINEEDFVLQRRSQSKDYKMIFQITSRGFNVDAVRRSVESVKYWANKYLKDYEVWLVTEPDALINDIDGVKVIKVPSDFSTNNNTKFKARALEYAKGLRCCKSYARDDVWIYFMDEESVVGEDTILGIIDFIENNRGEIGQGLIVYSNLFGKNLLTSLADSIRSSLDVSLYYFQIMTGFVIWMHGSHLLMRSDIEASIGWDFGTTWGEDSLFILEAQRRGYRLRWLKGRLYEQSPFTIRDFLKQRRRWVFHSLDVLRRKTSVKVKTSYFYSLLAWALGLLNLFIAILSIQSKALFLFNNSLILLTALISAYWISSYTVGLYLNTQPLGLPLRKLALYSVVAVVVGSLLEGIAVWYSILSAVRMQDIGFEVIKK
ncbi:MAG: glycosyltransferase family 2 protein [Sulfolobaceae archaeon]|nr:glycosyltransferase family 2 protein [Sulfolobales archaeon]